jgi:CheY-like chemotaxis protein
VKTILIIEDEPSNSALADVVLRRLNCQTIIKRNGLAGLDRAHRGDIDLIILDIALPGVNGWDVLTTLRKDPVTVDVPVLVLTAHAGEESMGRAFGGGANDFIEKPYAPEELRVAARKLLGETEEGSPSRTGTTRGPL